MSIETFESLSLTICLTGLIGWMLYIMWRLCKDSNAGKFGMFVIFGALGLGVFAFVIKEAAVYLLDH